MRWLMIGGYVDQLGSMFCPDCWVNERPPGRDLDRVLNTEDAEDPNNTFWIVDRCERCGTDLKYKSITMLG
jgi:hypothetical protein